MPIRRSPTLVPVGPVCTRSPAASSAVPESNVAERALHVAARELRALDAAGIDNGTGVVGRPIGSIGAGGENGQRFAGAQQPRRGQRQMRIAPAATVLRRQLDRRFAAPDQPIGRGRAQCLDELAAPLRGIAVEARGAGFELQAMRAAPPARRRSRPHRRSRRCGARSRSRGRASRPNNPEPMTSGSSPGTSEMNNASARRSPSSRAMPPPLMRDSPARSPFSVAMSQPQARPLTLSARRSSSETPSRSASTRLELPPDTRNSGSTVGRAVPARHSPATLHEPGCAGPARDADSRPAGRFHRAAQDRSGRSW